MSISINAGSAPLVVSPSVTNHPINPFLVVLAVDRSALIVITVVLFVNTGWHRHSCDFHAFAILVIVVSIHEIVAHGSSQILRHSCILILKNLLTESNSLRLLVLEAKGNQVLRVKSREISLHMLNAHVNIECHLHKFNFLLISGVNILLLELFIKLLQKFFLRIVEFISLLGAIGQTFVFQIASRVEHFQLHADQSLVNF